MNKNFIRDFSKPKVSKIPEFVNLQFFGGKNLIRELSLLNLTQMVEFFYVSICTKLFVAVLISTRRI